MIPVDDWMVVKMWEPQKDSMIELPEIVDATKDESAVFEVIKVGKGWWQDGLFHDSPVKPGDIVIMYGLGSVGRVKLPKDKWSPNYTYVGQARNVAFVLEKKDLGKEG